MIISKRNFVKVFFQTLLIISLVHAGDAGFIIRKKSFSLTVRFNIIQSENPPKGWPFLYKPDAIFFEALQWALVNSRAIENMDSAVTLRFEPDKEEVAIYENDNVEKVKNIRYDGKTIVDSFKFLLNDIYKVDGKKPHSKENINLYMVESKEYLDSFNKSEIFWGSFSGYIYDYSTKTYRAYFWDKIPDSFFEQSTNQQKIKIKKSNIDTYFSELE